MARGGAFYHVPHVFEQYRRLRFEEEFPILGMEEPAFLDVLGPVTGLRIADLGCGEGLLGQSLLEAGCARYLGVDGSANMVEAARETLRDTAGEALADLRECAPRPERVRAGKAELARRRRIPLFLLLAGR